MAEGYGTPGKGYDFVSEFSVSLPMTMKNSAQENVTAKEAMTASVTIPIPDGYTGEGAFARTMDGQKISDAIVDGDTVTFNDIPMEFDGTALRPTLDTNTSAGVVFVEWKKSSSEPNPIDPKPTDPDANADVSDKPEIPQTGDNSDLALWMALLVINGGAIATTTVVGGKKRHDR